MLVLSTNVSKNSFTIFIVLYRYLPGGVYLDYLCNERDVLWVGLNTYPISGSHIDI